MYERPINLLLLGLKSADKPGQWLRNDKELDALIQENKEDDEAIAKRFNLW